jgi:prepilin signal peptidase PulO-like enzyme (type II secretory pathway)
MLLIIVNLLLGWIGAAAVNYLADILPTERKITSPKCEDCGEILGWKYYLLLRPCSNCDGIIRMRHRVVIVLLPILAGVLYFYPPENLGNFGGLFWLFYFCLVVIIDLEHRLILHPVSIAGAVLGALFGSINHGIWNTILGGAAGFGIMLVFYFLGELFVRILSRSRGTEIDEIALGFGDVNLAGVIGLLLGWPGVLAGILLAILLGGVVSGLILVIRMVQRRYQAFQALPYGPFLVLSAAALLYISSLI